MTPTSNGFGSLGLGFRPALAGDLEDLYALHVAAMRQYVEQTWGWDDAFQRAHFREHFVPSGLQVITCAGADVGVLSLEQRHDDLFLRNIEIHPAYQRRGFGTAILQRVLAEAAAKGKPVFLRVLRVNPACALYRRLGFSIVDETSTHFHMRATLQPGSSDS